MDMLEDDNGAVQEAGEEKPEGKAKKKFGKEKPPKEKKKKEPKPKKEKRKKEKPKREKADREKKPLSAGKAALITALAFLLLIGGAAGAVILDVGGCRAAVSSLLQGGEDVAKTEKELELMAREKDLAKKEEDVAKREKTANSRESALNKKENELRSREVIVVQSEQEAADEAAALEQLAEVYSRMEPINAAQILSQIKNTADVTDILRQMKQNKVADILAAMTPELASELTVQMKDAQAVVPTSAPATTE